MVSLPVSLSVFLRVAFRVLLPVSLGVFLRLSLSVFFGMCRVLLEVSFGMIVGITRRNVTGIVLGVVVGIVM